MISLGPFDKFILDVGRLGIRMTPPRRRRFFFLDAAVWIPGRRCFVLDAAAAAIEDDVDGATIFFDEDSPSLFWNRVGSLIFLPDLLLLFVVVLTG